MDDVDEGGGVVLKSVGVGAAGGTGINYNVAATTWAGSTPWDLDSSSKMERGREARRRSGTLLPRTRTENAGMGRGNRAEGTLKTDSGSPGT